jgi:hypothetical protein
VIGIAEAASRSIADLERALGRAPDSSSTEELFEAPHLRWYRHEQHFDARGYVELLRTTSLYGSLEDDVRTRLLDGVEARIRERMGNHAVRRYLVALRMARRRS